MSGGCRCWTNGYSLAHDGHCCFIKDDRTLPHSEAWRADEDICHVPTEGETA